jgi:arsenate reductase-like glutaredoxin family protein
MTEVTIYHNSDCGTSRNTVALIHNAGGITPNRKIFLKIQANPRRGPVPALASLRRV